MKIHLLGPCGSGTSTVGRLIAKKYNYAWFDSDDFYWHKTNPPYTQKRTIDERINLINATLEQYDSWVLSGSMLKWGNHLRDAFDLVIYLYVDKDKRIKRLEKRERQNFGDRIDPGNDMGEIHKAFIEYSKRYEDGGMDIRSRLSENEWMKELKCKILRIESNMETEDEIELVSREIEKIDHRTTASTL